MRTRVAIQLGETKVNDVDHMTPRTPPHQKVVGLNISVNVALGMDNLQAAEELVRKHEHRLEIEAPAAIIEKILQALAEQIYDHDVVVAFDAIPTHARNANLEIGERRRRGVVRRDVRYAKK